MAKRFKICGLYILRGSSGVVHSSSTNKDFHNEKKPWNLRSKHGRCLEIVLDHFNEFYKIQGINMYLNVELRLSLG